MRPGRVAAGGRHSTCTLRRPHEEAAARAWEEGPHARVACGDATGASRRWRPTLNLHTSPTSRRGRGASLEGGAPRAGSAWGCDRGESPLAADTQPAHFADLTKRPRREPGRRGPTRG